MYTLLRSFSILIKAQISTATTWLQVMDVSQILALLDRLSSVGYSNSKLPVVLEAMMVTLARSTKQGAASGIASRLPVLLSIQSNIPESIAWEQVIDIAVDACLPAFYDGKSLPNDGSQRSLGDVVTQSWSRWRALTSNTFSIELAPFLERTTWTDLTASIIARLVYSQTSQRDTVVQWFRGGRWTTRLSRHVTMVLQALFDTSLPSTFFSQEDEEMLGLVCKTLLAETPGPFEHEFRRGVIFSIKAVADTHPAVGSKTVVDLQGELKSRKFNSTLCELAMVPGHEGSLGSAVVNKGLKWAVDVFSDRTISADDKETLGILRRALERVEVKAHYAESVVTVVIQNHLPDKDALVFLQTLLDRVQFKVSTSVQVVFKQIVDLAASPSRSTSISRTSYNTRSSRYWHILASKGTSRRGPQSSTSCTNCSTSILRTPVNRAMLNPSKPFMVAHSAQQTVSFSRSSSSSRQHAKPLSHRFCHTGRPPRDPRLRRLSRPYRRSTPSAS